MNPLFLFVLGAGGLLWWVKTHPSKLAPSAQAALDPNMDGPTSAAVAAALKSETDPATLTTFADKLAAAGFGNSAAALQAKAQLYQASPFPLPGFSGK